MSTTRAKCLGQLHDPCVPNCTDFFARQVWSAYLLQTMGTGAPTRRDGYPGKSRVAQRPASANEVPAARAEGSVDDT